MSDDAEGGRTKRVTFYVSESEQNALKREADERDKSLSAYCLQLIRRQRQLDAEDQLAEDLNVEQRLEEITQRAIDRIDDSVEDVEETTEALRDLHARAGNYPLVNFRILMRAHRPPEAWINEQFTWSRNRLREPLSEHDPTDAIVTGESNDDVDENQQETGKVEDVDDLI
ncbi:hypothetical protein [Halalkalicoccus sp. NIPERK01]|uniref:hypothetical protein n=1 Tax=Halalkalicoccus sp. NIPERK01 TaxID=3053469 RepID=UPI00256E9C49|nr:hypothetical protein [Halalkalicoccus sp. NIPERK01]MDL5363898.1 hypothetical protein [Halalkalicoccus sp. NIPERK01]